MRYANLKKRVAANVVDSIFLSIISAAVLIPYGMYMMAMQSATLGLVTVFVSAVLFNIWVMYFTYFEWSRNQTPGKKMFNIKVAKADYSQISFTDALARNVMRLVDALPAVYIVAIAASHLSNSNQRIGDFVAQTIVIED